MNGGYSQNGSMTRNQPCAMSQQRFELGTNSTGKGMTEVKSNKCRILCKQAISLSYIYHIKCDNDHQQFCSLCELLAIQYFLFSWVLMQSQFIVFKVNKANRTPIPPPPPFIYFYSLFLIYLFMWPLKCFTTIYILPCLPLMNMFLLYVPHPTI